MLQTNASSAAEAQPALARDLAGRSVIVTGSTSGIGLGIARALAAQGANLVINGFGAADEIETLRRDLAGEHGVEVLFSGADLSRPDKVVELIDFTIGELGQVDILVNNAGIQHVAPIETFPPERWDAVLAINLSAAFHATRAVFAGMKERRWGASSTCPPPTG